MSLILSLAVCRRPLGRRLPIEDGVVGTDEKDLGGRVLRQCPAEDGRLSQALDGEQIEIRALELVRVKTHEDVGTVSEAFDGDVLGEGDYLLGDPYRHVILVGNSQAFIND